MHLPRLLLVGALLPACSSAEPNAGCRNPAVTFATDTLVLMQGGSASAPATVSCAGDPQGNVTITYSSSDTSIFQAGVGGAVTGVRGGGAQLVAAAQGDTARLPVLVFGHPAGILTVTRAVADSPEGVSVTHDGQVLVARYYATALSRYQLPGLTPLPDVPAPLSTLDIAATASGRAAYLASYDQQQITFLRLDGTAAPGPASTAPGRPLRLLLSPTESQLFATTDLDSVYRIDPATGTIGARAHLPTAVSGSAPFGLVLSPDNSRLIVASTGANVIHVLAAGTLAYVDSFSVGGSGSPNDLAMAPTGDTLYLAAASPPGVHLWHLPTRAFLTHVPLPSAPYSLKPTPDLAYLYAVTDNGLYIIPRRTLTVSAPVPLGPGPVRRLAFDRFGRTALITSEAGYLWLVE